MAKRLHLGCGGNYLKGYVNIDQYASKVDERNDILTMEYPACSEIRSHHVFEHFSYVNSLILLGKWSLALIPGGHLIIDVPDVYRLAQALYGGSMKKQRACMRLLFGSHEGEWAYHINGWTPAILEDTLKKIGFYDFHVREYGSNSGEFPHMGFEMLCTKRSPVPKGIIEKRLIGLLSDYTHPNESQLLQLFTTQFKEGFK